MNQALPNPAQMLHSLSRELLLSARILGPIEAAIFALIDLGKPPQSDQLRDLQSIDRLDQRLHDLAQLASGLAGLASAESDPRLPALVAELRLEELRHAFAPPPLASPPLAPPPLTSPPLTSPL